MNTITLNGKNFELYTRKNPLEKSEPIEAIETGLQYYNKRTLYDAYNQPSTAKVSIWNNWKDFFDNYILRSDVYSVEYCVAGASAFTFTILAHISFLNGEQYYMRITPSHNKLYYYHD